MGVAIFPRDRFAALLLRDPIPAGGQFTSQPLTNSSPAELKLNVDGLSETANLRVELIDKFGAPIPGYAGSAAAIVTTSGLNVRVAWPGGAVIRCPNQAYRLRIHFTGIDAPRIRFYAAYLE